MEDAKNPVVCRAGEDFDRGEELGKTLQGL